MKLYSGIWPIAPIAFNPDGMLDDDGNRCILDCMIDQGSDGICSLADYSEQFRLSDAKREALTRLCLEHVAGHVPVIVTISHFATDIAVARARHAKDMGADIVMMLAPYHEALVKGSPVRTFEQCARLGEVGSPIMLQDAPSAGIEPDVTLLAKMTHEIEMLKLFKIESDGTAAKLCALLAVAADHIDGPFVGEEGITLLADLDAGATGTMTCATITDKIKPVVTHYLSKARTAAMAAYSRVLPVIHHENRQCGFRAAKETMKEGGVIKSAFGRHPIPPLAPEPRAALLELLRSLDPVALCWGK